MRSRAVHRMVIEAELREAVSGIQLAVPYQLIVSTGDRQLAAVEALVRWNHPTRGLLGPDTFIPIAEETGLIVALGEWVLHAACRDIVGIEGMALSVNISARQLHDDRLCERVSSILSATRFDPRRLTLEVTESASMSDVTLSATVLRQLRELGLSIAVDHFGTGYSSLNYLSRFPIDSLKVDRSFVDGLCDATSDGEIVRAVIGLAHSLGMRATAEGVETEANWLNW